MKTTNVLWVGDCPEWDDEVPANRLEEFKALLKILQQSLLASAAAEIIDDQHPREWHLALFSRFVPRPYYAGNYRQPAAIFECLQVDVEVDGVAGTHWRDVPEAVQDLFVRVAANIVAAEIEWEDLPPTKRVLRVGWLVAELVGQFIRIHPFLNGNGRVSRLIWRWILFRFGVSPQCTIFPRPSAPYSGLMAAAMRGNHLPLALAVIDHLGKNAPRQDPPPPRR